MNIEQAFDNLSLEAEELYLTTVVPRVEAPTSVSFLRDWVMPNKPVVFKNVFNHWPGRSKWSNDYLREKIGKSEITVAVTPNGYADAVNGNLFVMPEERIMTMGTFLDIIDEKSDRNGGVFYVQKQNSNLTEEFDLLLDDASKDIPWASEAFGTQPDAVNFWMGESGAVTSMHKDPYENLYCVVSGSKTFTLIPPTDQAYIPYGSYEAAKYHQGVDGAWSIIKDEQTGRVPWIDIDPLQPNLDKYPNFAKAHVITVTVNEGETLYLPSLWFHHVQQTHGCIAVNFWYDMSYDIKYAYFKFVESLIKDKRNEEEVI